MAAQHQVINAVNGMPATPYMTSGEFNRWYDQHAFWRKPRSIEEVHPDYREAYSAAPENQHWLVNA